jgi:hypothetical protein
LAHCFINPDRKFLALPVYATAGLGFTGEEASGELDVA